MKEWCGDTAALHGITRDTTSKKEEERYRKRWFCLIFKEVILYLYFKGCQVSSLGVHSF